MIELIIAAAICVAVGGFVGSRIRASQVQTVRQDAMALHRNIDEAENRYLSVLRREIANILITIDPNLMVRAYEKGWQFQEEMNTTPERVTAEMKSLTLKYHFFSEFDFLGTRHFIPYEISRKPFSTDELIEHYIDISKMILLNKILERKHEKSDLFTEKEFEILRETVQRCFDRFFKRRLKDAVRRYYALERAIDTYCSKEAQAQPPLLSETDVEVIPLPYDGPETELGIILKGTNEYGIFGTFHDDNGKIFKSYYRSNAAFNERRIVRD